MVWNSAIWRLKSISIANLVEATWLSRYHIPIEITNDQGLELIGIYFRKSLIKEEYGVTAKPRILGKPHSQYGIRTDSPGYWEPSA